MAFTDLKGGDLSDGFAHPMTQKAKGVLVLRDKWNDVPFTQLAWDEQGVRHGYRIVVQKGKVFVRPCPLTPRHGFVESRAVENEEEAVAVFYEAKAVDPFAELLMMPLVAAVYNLIWTPTLIAIGPGHDGATAGHGSLQLPLVQVPYNHELQKLVTASGINPPDVPYIEVVQKAQSDGGTPMYTQMRAGPLIPTGVGADYIPETFTVEHVVEAQGDLLEWEAIAKTLKPKTAVWHPGGTMISHYAVHCAKIKVAILTSTEPKVGDVLEKKAPPPMHAGAARSGCIAGLGMEIEGKKGDYGKGAVSAILYGLHNTLALYGADSFYVGVAAGLMVRLGTAAALGEMRHALSGDPVEGTLVSRHIIHERAIRSIWPARRKLGKALRLFYHHKWHGGYGGPAWASCTEAVIALDRAIVRLVTKPTAKRLELLVGALNTAVNQAHNNGWWLNKFCDVALFDKAASGEVKAFIPGARFLYEAKQMSPALFKDHALRAQRMTWINAEYARLAPLPAVQRTLKHKSVPQPVSSGSVQVPYNPADYNEIVKDITACAIQVKVHDAYTNISQKPDGGYTYLFGTQPTGKDAMEHHIQFEYQTADGHRVYASQPMMIPAEVMAHITMAADKVTSLAGSVTQYWRLTLFNPGTVPPVAGHSTFFAGGVPVLMVKHATAGMTASSWDMCLTNTHKTKVAIVATIL